MMELTPFFEVLRKVFIVTGILGAIETLGFYLFITRWYMRSKGKSE